MRKFVVITILGVGLSLGLQAGLSRHWWGALACGLAAALWLALSREPDTLTPAVSLLILVGVCAVGIYRGYHQLWTFTNLVLLLAAWDLDAFVRDLEIFSDHKDVEEHRKTLTLGHLKRLGRVVLAGWSLGAAALSVRIPINFGIALFLAVLAVLSLRWVLRSLV